MNRDIKFRAFWNNEMQYNCHLDTYGGMTIFEILNDKDYPKDYVKVMQYTGLKDKNVNKINYVYEGDILSLEGIVIGNIYENKDLLKERTNLVITEMGCEEWRSTEQEAIKRGCWYAK